MRVVEQRRRLTRARPAHLVDLVRRDRLRVRCDHHPVPHLLRAAARVDVRRRLRLSAEQAAQAGLLLDLAERRVPLGLARLELPLRAATSRRTRAGGREAPRDRRLPDGGRAAGGADSSRRERSPRSRSRALESQLFESRLAVEPSTVGTLRPAVGPELPREHVVGERDLEHLVEPRRQRGVVTGATHSTRRSRLRGIRSAEPM